MNLKLLSSIFKILSGNVLARGLSFLSSVMCARLLGVDDFGLFTFFFIVFTLVWQTSQSFDIVFVSRSSSDNSLYLMQGLIIIKLFYAFFCIIISAIIYIFIFFSNIHNNSIQMLFFGTLAGAFGVYLPTLASVYQNDKKFWKCSLVYVAFSLLTFFSVLLLYFNKNIGSLNNIIYLYLLSAILAFVICSYILLIANEGINNILKCRRWALDIARHSQWVVFVSLFGYLFQRIDFLYISFFCKNLNSGLYSASIQISMVYSLLAGSISTVFLPDAKESIGSLYNFKKYLLNTIPIIFVLIFSCIILCFNSSNVLLFVYGSEFVEGAGILNFVLIAWLFYVMSIPLYSALYALNDFKFRFYLELIKLLAVLLFMFYLVEIFGEIGAAISVAVVNLITFIYSIYFVVRTVKKRASIIN